MIAEAFLVCALALPEMDKTTELKELRAFVGNPYIGLGAAPMDDPIHVPEYPALERFILSARPGHTIMLLWGNFELAGHERLPFRWHGYQVFVKKIHTGA